MRASTIWPALILAARRKERVTGRTETLVDSIDTKSGFSHNGAPPGRRPARNFIGSLIKEERIKLSHNTRPNVRVKIRCLDSLKTYGVSPIRLKISRSRKRAETIPFHPMS